MQPLRIYVCGAHSTGKTTLARHLARELRLPLINEVARQVIAEMELSFEMLRVDLERAGEYQREVFKRQMEVEERYPDGFVSDRTFDNLAYAARHTLVIPQLLDAAAQRYFARVRESLVLYVRPHRECMADDGTREQVAWDEINRIDGVLDFLLQWQQIPCIGISELNMKDRVRTAMTAVRLYERACLGAPALPGAVGASQAPAVTGAASPSGLSAAGAAAIPPPRRPNGNGQRQVVLAH